MGGMVHGGGWMTAGGILAIGVESKEITKDINTDYNVWEKVY